MTSEANKNYTISKEEDKLIFATPSFRVGPESVLHSGIYNREFSSVLASAVMAGIAYVLAAINTGNTIANTIVRAMVFLMTFAAGFPFFRKFVFKGSLMEVVFNTASGETKIYTSWITRKLKETIPVKNIHDISIESRKHEAENPDAVRFVKQISLQHGTVIPGFGEEKAVFLLKLHLSDGSERVIYSDSSMHNALSAHGEIKEFLKI